MKNPKLKQLKQELKDLAAQIKADKPAYRMAQSTCSKLLKQDGSGYKDPLYKEWDNKKYALSCDVHKARWVYRHKHIAYCILRGRTRSQIENPKPENKPNEELIAKYLIEYVMPGLVDEVSNGHAA